jgi:zinc protease
MDREAMPGASVELAWIRELVPGIGVEELGALARARDGKRGRVVDIRAAKGAPTPTEARVRAILATKSALGPWKDEVPRVPLLATEPSPGKIVATTHDPSTDVTTWTLENGIRVLVKPTLFANETLHLTGWQPGGTSLVSDEDFVHARFSSEIMATSGAGSHSQRTLRRLLSGKRVSLDIELLELGASIEGRARPADVGTLLAYLHLRLTRPRAHRHAFDAWKQGALETLKHREDSPDEFFSEQLALLRSNAHLRRRPADARMIAAVDMDRALALYRERFRDLGGSTFAFVGNIDLAVLKPLVERYLGGLPSSVPHEQWRDPQVPYPVGIVEKRFRAGSEPRSRVVVEFVASHPFNADVSRDARVFELLLQGRLTERLREQLAGVYKVDVRAAVRREPTGQRLLSISFACAPANVDKLRSAVFEELSTLARDGPDKAEVARVREQLVRRHRRNVTSNSFWLGWILYAHRHGDDLSTSVDLDALLARVSGEQVKQTARRMFDPKRYLIAVLDPEGPSPSGKQQGRTASDEMQPP